MSTINVDLQNADIAVHENFDDAKNSIKISENLGSTDQIENSIPIDRLQSDGTVGAERTPILRLHSTQ